MSTNQEQQRRWRNSKLHVCPDCRAGKEWLRYTYQDTPAIARQKVESECLRCGYTKTETIKL